ncbi:molecular chaperone [Paenibacillus thiaminolyticus]|uniref:molecular chaperone n=1 Tax=Paenibacillus TaxID=44249 RepID=UPI00105A9754|nr:molecular chaperone [Paenibacillus dendritiformis]TDL54084.1 molecular chaperone [Paenibacillus dendritiformis]
MDKRTVIAAYQRGELTIHECAQIIGVEVTLKNWLPLLAEEERAGTAPAHVRAASKRASVWR